MFVKLFAAVLVFFLTVAGFHYAGANVSGLVVAATGFVLGYLAFKAAPSE